MLVVNLFGVPGAGKSTGAAYVFSKLKMAGVNAELVTEYAKDKVWDGGDAAFDNHAYIFGNQYYRLSRLEGKVDVVVTDSPIILSGFYNMNDDISEELNSLTTKAFGLYNNYNVIIDRVKGYNPNGRLQTESESDDLKEEMEEFLSNRGIECTHFTGDEEGYKALTASVFMEIERLECA